MTRTAFIGALVLSICNVSTGEAQNMHPAPQPATVAMLNRAQDAIEARQWDKAIVSASQALASADLPASGVFRARQMRAAAYIRRGEYEKAIEDTNAILPRDAFNVARNNAECHGDNTAHRSRGIAYGGLHQYDKAIHELTCALSTPIPWFAFCWHFDRGQMYERKGEDGLAAVDYAEGGRLEPKRARQLYCVGVTKRELGDVGGLIYILQAEAIEPNIVSDMQALGNMGF